MRTHKIIAREIEWCLEQANMSGDSGRGGVNHENYGGEERHGNAEENERKERTRQYSLLNESIARADGSPLSHNLRWRLCS